MALHQAQVQAPVQEPATRQVRAHYPQASRHLSQRPRDLSLVMSWGITQEVDLSRLRR